MTPLGIIMGVIQTNYISINLDDDFKNKKILFGNQKTFILSKCQIIRCHIIR